MKVKCIAMLPNKEQAKKLGSSYQPGKQGFNLSIGEEYTVYGIRILSGNLWIELLSDTEYLYAAPLCLFKIIDGHVSRYWEIRINHEENIFIWPSSFYREYYHDDLFEGIPEVVEDFRKNKYLIEKEASNPLK